jgi:hypothetical protein
MSKEEYSALVMKALKNVKPPKDVSMKEIERRIAEQQVLIEELQQ